MKFVRILALLLVGVLVYQGGRAVERSRSLQLDEFQVEGNTEARISTDAVVEATDARVGDHLLGISTEEVSKKVELMPWVAKARVERILPSTLRISVEEREPSFEVLTGQGPFLVDAGGLVLQPGSEELVKIVDLPLSLLSPGGRISAPEFTHASRILRSLPAGIRTTVTSIRAPSIDQIQIETADGPTIYYGAAEQMEEKNFAAEAVIERTMQGSSPPTIVDVRVPSRPVTRAR